MNYFLDLLFEALHIFVIVFNLTGWFFSATRFFHFILISLTAFSWLGLGFFYGWGYCFLTDIHWSIKRSLGEYQLPNSYIAYLLEKMSVDNVSHEVIDWIVGSVFCLVFLLSNFLFIKKKSKA